MPFKKGQGGRQKGALNKVSRDVQHVCRTLVEDPGYLAYIKHRLEVGQLAPGLEIMLWAYAYGKPQERLDVTGTGTLTISWGLPSTS